jgi:hypothetical protein
METNFPWNVKSILKDSASGVATIFIHMTNVGFTQTVCISLCKSCMQGFHETCLRKWVQGETMVKQIQVMQCMYPYGPLGPYQIQNSPYMVMGPGVRKLKIDMV